LRIPIRKETHNQLVRTFPAPSRLATLQIQAFQMMRPARCRGGASTRSVAVLWPALLHTLCGRAAAKVAEDLVIAAGTTVSPNAGELHACVDEANTGVRFDTDGSIAKCSDLENYCTYKDGKVAAHIQESCAKTCGFCDVSDRRFMQHHADGEKNCSDQAANAVPVFTVAGQTYDCPDLKAFCHGHPDSEFVMQKCGHSCGVCPTVYTEGLNYKRTCDRRRRWGFCATRRREFTFYEGGGRIIDDHEPVAQHSAMQPAAMHYHPVQQQPLPMQAQHPMQVPHYAPVQHYTPVRQSPFQSPARQQLPVRAPVQTAAYYPPYTAAR